jgi:hypothetical protein
MHTLGLFRRVATALLFSAVIGDALAGQRDTVVRNAGAPRHAGMSTLVQELSIGVVNGPDEYTFGNITELAVAPDGSIYALDRSAFRIRVYDSAGRHVRSFGRQGQGPGDLASPAGLAVLPDGRVLVWDTQQRRMTVFAPSGESIATWPSGGDGASGGTHGLVIDAMGVAYARLRTLARPPSQPRDAPEMRSAWLGFRTTDGAVVDSIVEPSSPPFAEPLRASVPGHMRQMAMPFSPRRIATLSPRGVVVSGIAERYAFDLVPRAGAVTSVRRVVEPAPIAARTRDSARADIETKMREVDTRWTWPDGEVPRLMPFFVEILVGADGRIWLQRDQSVPPLVAAPSQGRAGASGAGVPDPNVDFTYRPTHFDVFEPDGAFLGEVELPPKVTPMVMRGDVVWAVAKDADDVQFIRRYHITWK